ncbi:hypothetical protein RRG08_060027 [Elysia crispata]|uniref:Uncharacterized protein n=1 Tax=Elysia crispata TaxID=231223 RepID=A0AAE1CXR4_9GAST|nr:hypothetical protein RRG08_060027 [Elysia crispata]
MLRWNTVFEYVGVIVAGDVGGVSMVCFRMAGLDGGKENQQLKGTAPIGSYLPTFSQRHTQMTRLNLATILKLVTAVLDPEEPRGSLDLQPSSLDDQRPVIRQASSD